MEYFSTLEQIDDNKQLLDDEELGEPKEELKVLEPRVGELEDEIKLLYYLLTLTMSAISFLEIRAGTGGDEAAIFSADLFKAYLRYAENRMESRSCLIGVKVSLMATKRSSL